MLTRNIPYLKIGIYNCESIRQTLSTPFLVENTPPTCVHYRISFSARELKCTLSRGTFVSTLQTLLNVPRRPKTLKEVWNCSVRREMGVELLPGSLVSSLLLCSLNDVLSSDRQL